MVSMEKIRALPRTLTSRRGAWVWALISIVTFVALFGFFGRATAPSLSATAPLTSESARVADILDTFPNADQQSVIVVISQDDDAALSPAVMAASTSLTSALSEETGLPATGPVPSEDGKAAVIVAPMVMTGDNTENAEHLKELRSFLAEQKDQSAALEGASLLVTGGPAFGADIAGAFEGADLRLLLVTIAIVAVLLILTYRSPVLWLIPLVVVALADQLASNVTAWLGAQANLQFDAGIISVLVFGAGTNYALLLISRYREELRLHANHRTALGAAWKHTAPAILASNLTVVVALATLVFATIPGTRGLGVASAAGLVIALVAVLFALPPVLAIVGRKVFWPFIPRVQALASSNTSTTASPAVDTSVETNVETNSVWHRIASTVVRKPLVSLLSAVSLLAVMTAGLLGTSVGLNQLEKFREPSESAAGLQVLSQHFSPGEAQPLLIVADSTQAQAVADRAAQVGGVVRANITGESADGALSKITVTGDYATGTPESLTLVNELRDAVHEVPGANALVGGAIATDADARSGNLADFLLVVPLVLAVCLAVLVLLLRSIVAPVLLVIVNSLSALAAIGAGSWLSRQLFNQPALDLQVPLLAFLFLVALGIDYTIFLVHRARHESLLYGTRAGMVRAVTGTGGVITSAGIVLAGVFAALGVLPLVTLGQLGLIVGLGVVVDTLVVRTVLVPALFSLVGEAMWWPGKLAAGGPHSSRRDDPHSVHGAEVKDSTHDNPATTPQFVGR
ncbi:MMPL family transporter [Neomicrococcus aestuarii]